MKKRNWYLTLGLSISAVMLLYTAIGFFWTPYDPGKLSSTTRYAAPSLEHLFGCDSLGRDIFSRTLDGAGATLTIALSVLAIGFFFGLLIGSLCGYYGGVVDAAVMRICDAIASFPSILLAMVIIAVIGQGKYKIIIALGILFIPRFSRLVRSEYIKYRDRDFVRAARLAGIPSLRIIFLHILPNTWPVLLSGLTIGFNNAVLAEASMSYLGIGVGPADASLGRMLSEAQSYLITAPWCTIFPALVVVLLILGVGMVGEGIRERMGENEE
jgi:peptide/nickel transport system permease protein